MDKRTLIGIGLLVVVIVFSLEWLRSGPSLEIPPEVLQQDIFIESAGLGDATTMLEMIEHGVDINGHNPVFGHTALIVASRFGHYKIVQTLLDRGAEVNAEDDYGFTALYWAKKNHKDKVIELLESAGGTSPAVKGEGEEPPVSDV